LITVCPNTGYQSWSRFTRTFPQAYGSDPSEYRAKAQRTPSSSVAPTEDAIEESDAA
jgi:AraC-like DNA-binding protein